MKYFSALNDDKSETDLKKEQKVDKEKSEEFLRILDIIVRMILRYIFYFFTMFSGKEFKTLVSYLKFIY
jgi:hypothetical protein